MAIRRRSSAANNASADQARTALIEAFKVSGSLHPCTAPARAEEARCTASIRTPGHADPTLACRRQMLIVRAWSTRRSWAKSLKISCN